MSPVVKLNDYWFPLDQIMTWRKLSLFKRIWLKLPKPFFSKESNYGAWQTRLCFTYYWTRFPLMIKNETLIKIIKETMKECSNPTFTVAKGLDASPKEIDALKKKVIAEEMAKPDYLQLKQTLESLTCN